MRLHGSDTCHMLPLYPELWPREDLTRSLGTWCYCTLIFKLEFGSIFGRPWIDAGSEIRAVRISLRQELHPDSTPSKWSRDLDQLAGSARFAKSFISQQSSFGLHHCRQRNVLSTSRNAPNRLSKFDRALSLDSGHVQDGPSFTPGPQFRQRSEP